MTDEFKQTLFDYLIGRLPNEKGTFEEIFKEINILPFSDWPYGDILPRKWNNFRYEGLIKLQNSELVVLYGGFKTEDNVTRGIITILDNSFKPIKTFYQFSNGNYLDYIMCMIQENDGTFTMTTCPDFPRDKEWSFTSSTKKFIMLNNFTQQVNNDYLLTMNKSYDIPYKNNYVKKMFKDPNSSHYVLLCSVLIDQNSPDYDKTRIVEVKINVGSENEWSYIDTDDTWILGDSYVEFDSDSKAFVELLLTSSLLNNYNIVTWTKNFNETNYTYKTIYTFDYKPYIDSVQYNNQSVFLNKNELYFVQNNQHWGNSGKAVPKYIGLYYYNVESEKLKTIYEHYLGDYDFCNLEAIYIVENNNKLYIEFNDNINENNASADYYFQRLENNQWNPIKISENQYFIYGRRALYVNNQFNLLNWFSYATNPQSQYWYLLNIKENYNQSKYNGQPYINTNTLISDNVEIYSNGHLVFARDLYNKSLNNNTTVSTVEIPNNYLNDIDITNKNLLSETNLNLVEDTNMVQKNIYETLYINFINTLLIIDRNSANQLLNQQTSTYLNNQINNKEGYSKAQIYPKVIITYQDNSAKEITFEYQDVEETSADIVFAIYVNKPMQDVKIVSNDKATIYQTINLTNLEQGKYYVIRQNLKII